MKRKLIVDPFRGIYTITNGSNGIYYLDEIASVKVCREQARFKGKSEPFSHCPLNESTMRRSWIGLVITERDGSTHWVYASDKAVRLGTDQYAADDRLARSWKAQLTA